MARPRDGAIDQRLVDAWRALSAETSYDEITMTAIADRAGVGKPSLYRRFPTKAHLAFAAGVGGSTPDELPDSGSLSDDLLPALEALVASLLEVPRSVYADQIAAAIADSAFARRVQDEYAEPALVQVMTLWDRAVARGEVDAEIDGRTALNDVAGSVIFDVMARHVIPDRKALELRIARFVHGVTKPAPWPPGSSRRRPPVRRR